MTSMLQRVVTDLKGVRLAGRPGHWDLGISGGRIATLRPSDQNGGGMVTPLFADLHVHLDKTYTLHRMPRRAGSLHDAIEMMAGDVARWTPEDIRDRAEHALARAWGHGTGQMRSHVDWHDDRTPAAWEVLGELAREWRGRIALELASLTPLDAFAAHGEAIARRVAASGGVLGAFIYRNADLAAGVARVFDLAERFDLALDFHVDEGTDPEAQGFDAVLAETERRGFAGRVLCGHACALSVRPANEVARLLDRAAAAGLGLVALPACNAWLQDATGGRTPRLRGLAPIREARAAGMQVMFGSDNVCDGFYPHGDYDPADAWRLAVLLGHLDPEDWLDAVTTLPAGWSGASAPLAEGAPADFIHFAAQSADELASRPTAGRTVWRGGTPIAPMNGAFPC
ncbi:MAG TPA: amidohydrolase family protein [Paracoccus sp. (in: a-proteobacteria)]|uniref:amidohydrolase family protein n=1 Tax=Paracoccus sp. TaxID=267 RepID=UPI002B7BB3D1|nr:amidohydrolase family protein [Paracoccus sp. (in: a-proteobacteria)]HWL56771.1 amidohydrolase family protein [Paracoccus sp. (in: a-proteobacteria)]